ncbi:hypothetical protein FOL47_008115 [Perkinsus chesapeaki]|uniref:Uncharacterized protein n=1 Tax=Perkinsus chesapeaki TaxID=330153 RepID=A0A7J6LG47_PERCH|nr:hypothetical protein FOL47_008115 [Perkinsus chesapeaki]
MARKKSVASLSSSKGSVSTGHTSLDRYSNTDATVGGRMNKGQPASAPSLGPPPPEPLVPAISTTASTVITPGPGQYDVHSTKAVDSVKYRPPHWSLNERPRHLPRDVPTWIETTISQRVASGPDPAKLKLANLTRRGKIVLGNKAKHLGGVSERFTSFGGYRGSPGCGQEPTRDEPPEYNSIFRPSGHPVLSKPPKWSMMARTEKGSITDVGKGGGVLSVPFPGPGAYDLSKRQHRRPMKNRCTFGGRPNNLSYMTTNWTPETFLVREARRGPYGGI